MKTAAIVLYVIQALAIICAIITGQEFIDFSSGPALFETIGFFFPAILGLIFDMVAHNKEQKAEQSSTEGPNADSAAPFSLFSTESQSRCPRFNQNRFGTTGSPEGSSAARSPKEELGNHCARSKGATCYRSVRSVLP